MTGFRRRQGHRLVLIVGAEHEGNAHLVLKYSSVRLGLFTQFLVEGAQGSSSSSTFGRDQGARQGDPLARPPES